MKILFDNNVPNQLKSFFTGHLIMPARKMGWARHQNGDLIRAAELELFDVLVSGDKNIFYQQDNTKRKIALVVLSGTKRSLVVNAHERIVAAVETSSPGSFSLIEL